jgi:hypothetical protein
MPSYRIHRLKAHLKQSFRSAPHVSGVANVKPRDYEQEEENFLTVEAATPYAAYFEMKETATPLEPGDLLEADGVLRIYKFVGFEEARWVLPEPKPADGAVEANTADAQSEPVLASNSVL